MGYTFIWAGELRVFVMAASANALKIAENIRGSRRTLLWAMVVAILLSVLGSSWIYLALGYRYGAVNLSGYYTGLVHYPFNFISRSLLNATAPDMVGWMLRGWGGLLMALLLFARQRFW